MITSMYDAGMKRERAGTEQKKAPGEDRLERYLAHAGLASRREAKEWIGRGLVTVNGAIAREPGMLINPKTADIKIKSEKLPQKETVLLYKPRGIETNATKPGTSDIASKFPKLAHLSPIGRLDKESEGLIILSNDGTLARALTAAESHVEKEYHVTVREVIEFDSLKKMESGIIIDKEKTKPAKLKRDGKHAFFITLTEGRKHQIRRMCDACHLTVESLVRVRIGHLTGATLKSGMTKQIALSDILKLKGGK